MAMKYRVNVTRECRRPRFDPAEISGGPWVRAGKPSQPVYFSLRLDVFEGPVTFIGLPPLF